MGMLLMPQWLWPALIGLSGLFIKHVNMSWEGRSVGVAGELEGIRVLMIKIVTL